MAPQPPPVPDAPTEAPTEARTDRRKPRLLSGLTCASCGGTVDVQEGWTNVTCRYCDTPLAVVGERGVVRVMVLDRIDRAAAGTAVRRWFSSGIRKEPALKRETRFEEAFLAFFPFVRTRFDVVGWILGVKKTKRKRRDRWETVETPVELQFERTVDRTLAASEMSEFGVHRVNLAGDELLPLDEDRLRRRGMVFRPNRAPAEAAEELTTKAMKSLESSSRLHRVTFSWLAVVRRHVAVAYYPLWVFRYSFRGRTYQVLVDAEDGSLAYGKAPGNHFYRALALVASTAGACFIGTTVLQNLGWLMRGENTLAALGVAGVALAALVAWGYSQFRHGGVVEEGSGMTEETASPDLEATLSQFMEKLG